MGKIRNYFKEESKAAFDASHSLRIDSGDGTMKEILIHSTHLSAQLCTNLFLLVKNKTEEKYKKVKMESKKILFACIPADGHFNPLTGLAIHLKNLGHDVRWYTQSLYQPKIEKMGIIYYPFKRPPQLNQENFEHYFVERKDKKGQVSKLKFDIENVFVHRIPEFFEDIEEIYQSFSFDLLIADIMFTAIPVVRKKLNVPLLRLAYNPLWKRQKIYHQQVWGYCLLIRLRAS
jgi:hypothetical protein